MIQQYRHNHVVPEIHRVEKERSLHYSVINGEEIEQYLPEVQQLYVDEINKQANQLTNQQLTPLRNKKVGVNINITATGGSYRWHYDRNAVTCILYLNTVQGGETEIFPKYRILLKKKDSRSQQLLDQMLRLKIMRQLFGRKVAIKPSQGTLVLMQGDECLHSVTAVEGNVDRINIILAYDVPGTEFGAEKNLDTYLYTQEETTSSDPNYSGSV
jgi:hypothetical protein